MSQRSRMSATPTSTPRSPTATAPSSIDFWAPWCGPCRQMEPAFEELAAANPSHKWVKVNVDENPATAARFQILAIPAFVVVEGGQETKRIAGAKPKGRFAAELGLGVPA